MPSGDSEMGHYKEMNYFYLFIKSNKRPQLLCVLSTLKGNKMGYDQLPCRHSMSE